jgi:hypothetical protein
MAIEQHYQKANFWDSLNGPGCWNLVAIRAKASHLDRSARKQFTGHTVQLPPHAFADLLHGLTPAAKIRHKHVESLVLVANLHKFFSASDICLHNGNDRVGRNYNDTAWAALGPHRDNRRFKLESSFSHSQCR